MRTIKQFLLFLLVIALVATPLCSCNILQKNPSSSETEATTTITPEVTTTPEITTTPAESTESTPAESTESTPAESTPAESTESTPAESTESTPAESTESTPAESTESTPAESTESTPEESTESTPEESTPSTPVDPDAPVQEEATISFDDVANRTEFDTSVQVWAQNGITVTNNKGTSDIADYSKPARFYKGSELIIAYPGMTKIVIACNTAAYATACQNSLADTNANVTVDGKNVIIVLAQAADSFSFTLSGGQVRVDSITVYTTEVDLPAEPEVTTPEETTPAEPEVTTPEETSSIVPEESTPAPEETTPDTPVEPETPAEEVTITFDDVAKRTEFDTSKQVWVQNGITITNNKGGSTSNVADYAKPARFYKNSELIIAYPGMTKIVIACNSASYATACQNSLTDAAATVTVDGKNVTITFAEAVSSFTFTLSGGQVRIDGITVYTTEATLPEAPEVTLPEETSPVVPEETTPAEPEETTPEETTPDTPAQAEATISFDDKANRTEFDTSKQVWVQNGITVTNNKGGSTSNVADYAKPARFYKSSELTITYSGITKIVIACNTTAYATACQNSLTDAAATVTVDGKNVTITFAEAVNSFTFTLSGGQVRVDSITVYA